ncbi:hypothetical protein N9W01_00240 [bacterium]|nr:hypothetical protein [bacterium]
MPAINTKLVLSSAAQSANVVLADIDLIKGALYGVSTESDLDNINSNYLSDGQLMFVQDVAKFFSLTITAANPPITFVDTYEWNEVTLGASGAITSDDTGSFVLASQTGSFLLASQTGSFLTTSSFNDATSSFTLLSDFNDITSSLSTFVVYSASNATTASYIDPTFISASAAASGFGAGGGSEVGGIFIQTGSYYATTNDLQITGSVTIGDGLLKFKEYDSLPSVEGGTIAYYDGVFWLGQDN